MAEQFFMLFEEEFERATAVVNELAKEAHAKGVFLIDCDGQLITGATEIENFDTTSLASLTASNVAATAALAQLLGGAAFPELAYQGDEDSIHISTIGQRAILVIVFDGRSTLGLVKLRVKKMIPRIARIFEDLQKRQKNIPEEATEELAEITDEDIEKLFLTEDL